MSAAGERAAGSGGPVRQLLGRGSIYTLGTLLQLSAAVIAIPVITRLLPPAVYGVAALALIVQLLVGAVAGAGLSTAITRTYYKDEAGPERARQLMVASLPVSAAIVAVLLVTGPLWAAPLHVGGYATPLVIATACGIPAAMIQTGTALLRTANRPAAFISVSLTRSIGAQVVGIVFLLLFERSATAYLAGYACAMTMSALQAVFQTRPVGAGMPTRAFLRESLAIGFPTIPHLMAFLLLAVGDRIVLGAVTDPATIGKYQAAYVIGGLATTLMSAVQNAWIPLVFSSGDERRWSVLATTTTAVLGGGIIVASALALMAPVGLAIIAPPSYIIPSSKTVVTLVAMSVIPYVAYLASTHVIIWEGKTATLAWITPVSAAINFVLVALLVGPFGIAGAAIATPIAFTFQAAATRRFANGYASVPWARSEGLRLTAVGLAAAGAALALPEGLAGNLVRALVAAIVAAIVLSVFREQVTGFVRAAAARRSGIAAPADSAAPESG